MAEKELRKITQEELRKITQEELNDIIEKHRHWLHEDVPGWEGMRAVLNFADLTGLNFRGADLSSAIIKNSDFRYSILAGANLYKAKLQCSNFSAANIDGACLIRALLIKTRFTMTSMLGTVLDECDLRDAYLSSVYANGASFNNADLRKASIVNGCCLFGADFRSANTDNTKIDKDSFDKIDPELMPESFISHDDLYIPMACPDSGSFIGWKKTRRHIIKLRIPEDALRSSAGGRKCRCSKAEVLEIQSLDGKPTKYKALRSNYRNDFVYRVGKTVEVDDFDTCRWNECTRGIHFFINRQEAVDYGTR